MENKKILIVDDEQDMRFTLSFILKRKGYLVEAADNGLKALEIINYKNKKSEAFDLVVCDLQMPVMNGEQFLDAIKQENAALPVLIVTGHGTETLLNKLLAKGCCGYLEKPFQPIELESKVESLFKKTS